MKLATLRDGSRDGRLVVVSRDLTRASGVPHIARTLQAALDDWKHVGPRLADVAAMLETGAEPTERFHERDALSPLPRAYQWADGSAYVNHVELVRKARGAEMPESFWQEPLMYQGGSDTFLAPRGPIRMADEAWGIDCEGEVAVIVGDVPMGGDAPVVVAQPVGVAEVDVGEPAADEALDAADDLLGVLELARERGVADLDVVAGVADDRRHDRPALAREHRRRRASGRVGDEAVGRAEIDADAEARPPLAVRARLGLGDLKQPAGVSDGYLSLAHETSWCERAQPSSAASTSSRNRCR